MGQAIQSTSLCCAQESCSGQNHQPSGPEPGGEIWEVFEHPLQEAPGAEVEEMHNPYQINGLSDVVVRAAPGRPERKVGGSADGSTTAAEGAVPPKAPRPPARPPPLGRPAGKPCPEEPGPPPLCGRGGTLGPFTAAAGADCRCPGAAAVPQGWRAPLWLPCRALCRLLGHSGSREPSAASGSKTPILLHFDVNKTVIHCDSVNAKSAEDGVREGVSDLFWGHVSAATEADGVEANGWRWQWTRSAPSTLPPSGEAGATALVTYFKFCKKATEDKDAFKTAVRTFHLVQDAATKAEMERLVALALERLQLPEELLASAESGAQLRAVGLHGATYFMVPTLFHLVATLQRREQSFALLFRSFGNDHEKIKDEWNAFCELRHPVFSRLISDIGPLDGSVPHLPDRRVHTLHTLYRDSEGPILILDTFTNGPADRTWDSWAKAKPKATADTRGGRAYIQEVLNAKTVEGLADLRGWMGSHLRAQATSAIKDDWAWWQFHGEQASAGKLLPLMGGEEAPRQVFFDDNIDIDDPRIVDCRDAFGKALPANISLTEGICVRVNPVEALLAEDYFLNKLQR